MVVRLCILLLPLVLASCQEEPQSFGQSTLPPPEETVDAPASPPIDCPLEKAGVDPHEMKPFEEVEDYISFLEREDRAIWQEPDAVVQALGLAGDEIVADVGAGSGYFTFRLAQVVPRGRVVALDIDPGMIRHIHHRAMTEGIENVEAILSEADDPQVPDGVDVVFICDVLHHVSDRRAWMSKIVSKMKHGARLVLIEFKEGDLPAGPPSSLKIPKSEMVSLLDGVGLKLAEEKTGVLPYQYFLVFARM
jgi:ubiquinone/menaquinone biosynthesis C-methylase UbiE